ncbi:MAG: glutamate 5-kinase [Candidatus Howiella sp.]
MSFQDAKRVVVKVGTSTLTYDNGKPNFRRIERLTRVISDLKNSGREVLLVSSGAIAVGVSRLGLAERPSDTKGKQAAAAVGQCDLMSLYDRAFSEYGYVTAQILLDRSVTGDERRKQNVVNTFDALLRLGAVPIVNENDSTSVEEIEFGDNDRLSAIVAVLAGADALVMMTDIDGLYDSDPRTNPDARRIPVVEEITDDLFVGAGGAGSTRGTGGMHTKLEGAVYATAAGVDVAIVRGDDAEILYDLIDGKPVGTYFPAGK